jgi:hypothetical protein
LLSAANRAFDVLVTADRNMHHQQNFAGLAISVLVFPTNRVRLVKAGVAALVQSLQRVRPGERAIMDMSGVADWSTAVLADVPVEHGIARHVFRQRVGAAGPERSE